MTHLICVDANKKLIYNSMDRYPMKLCKGGISSALNSFIGYRSMLS